MLKRIMSFFLAVSLIVLLGIAFSATEIIEIPRENYTAEATSEYETDPATNAIDGIALTIWHSDWNVFEDVYSITIGLGSKFKMSKMTVKPRPSGVNGRIYDYEIALSTDGKNFDTLTSGTWDYPDEPTDKDFSTPKEVDLQDKDATHVRITCLDGQGGWASISEVVFWGAPYEPDKVKYPEKPKEGVPVLTSWADNYNVAHEGELATDGLPQSIWHTAWENVDEVTLPASLFVKFDKEYTISGFKVLPRPEEGSPNGNIFEYNAYTSMDGENWDLQVKDGEWDYIEWGYKDCVFPTPVSCKYVKLEVLDGHGGFASAAEFELLNPVAVATVEEVPKAAEETEDNNPDTADSNLYLLILSACLSLGGILYIIKKKNSVK